MAHLAIYTGSFKTGFMVWENYRDEHALSGTELIPVLQRIFNPVRSLRVWARGLVNGQWTDASIINIYLG